MSISLISILSILIGFSHFEFLTEFTLNLQRSDRVHAFADHRTDRHRPRVVVAPQKEERRKKERKNGKETRKEKETKRRRNGRQRGRKTKTKKRRDEKRFWKNVKTASLSGKKSKNVSFDTAKMWKMWWYDRHDVSMYHLHLCINEVNVKDIISCCVSWKNQRKLSGGFPLRNNYRIVSIVSIPVY